MHLKSEELLPSLFSKRLTQFIFPGLREHLHFNMLVTLDVSLSSLLPIKCGKWYPPCFYWHFLLKWWHWASFQMFVIRVYSFVNCLFIFFCPFFILFAFLWGSIRASPLLCMLQWSHPVCHWNFHLIYGLFHWTNLKFW